MKSALKWHGGKAPLATKIVALMPKHVHYVEPYFGAGSVLFAKDPEGVSEVVNDIDKELTNFWEVLQNPHTFDRFKRLCEATPVSEAVWDLSELNYRFNQFIDEVDAAWRFFIRVRQSLAGRGRCFSPLSRTRTRRGMNEQVSSWLTAVEGLPAVHERLKRVAIFNRDALDVIRSQDGRETLFYLDPPYHPSTRNSPEVYGHEMTHDQHVDLLNTIISVKGKVMISGYPCQVYEDFLYDWHREEIDVANHAASGPSKRRMTETIWMNC